LNCWSSLLLCIKWSQEELPHLTNLIAEFFPSDCNSVMFIYLWFPAAFVSTLRVKMHRRLVHQEGQGLQRPDHCWAVDAAIALGEVTRSGLFMMCACLTEVRNWWWRVVSGYMLKVSEHTYHWQCWCKKSNKSVYVGSLHLTG
jgi:hypothetical protein